jgi:ligand-binding SRPBCC domain-containing protein
MIRIELETSILAPIERCFDLARSIDLHMASTNWTGEQAIAGVTAGLIGAGEQVTWRGRHFGLWITHTSRITGYERPTYFQDCMLRGWFRRFCHDHLFSTMDGRTSMKDVMEFDAPVPVLGMIAERLVLESHMRDLLTKRNLHIKQTAESEDWQKYLPA